MDLTLGRPERETRKGLSPAEMEPTRGLEPLTTCLQDRCATDCATSAVPRRSTGRAHHAGWAREMLPALRTPDGHPRAATPGRHPAKRRPRWPRSPAAARPGTRRRPGRGPPGLRVP